MKDKELRDVGIITYESIDVERIKKNAMYMLESSENAGLIHRVASQDAPSQRPTSAIKMNDTMQRSLS